MGSILNLDRDFDYDEKSKPEVVDYVYSKHYWDPYSDGY